MEIEISDMPTMDPQCSTSGVTEERESHFLGVYDKDDIGGAIKYVKDSLVEMKLMDAEPNAISAKAEFIDVKAIDAVIEILGDFDFVEDEVHIFLEHEVDIPDSVPFLSDDSEEEQSSFSSTTTTTSITTIDAGEDGLRNLFGDYKGDKNNREHEESRYVKDTDHIDREEDNERFDANGHVECEEDGEDV
ncbi:hypothetical protein EAI_05521 [Harpegnathos saltator]|uniref:Uncharacterized protein n=1 Tax=Harpegnathos saltator TaxID=610380 RepID=E2B4X1_HARSA|nr:hypothetical protein EAI_05521 [Harpegnathos saltator]